MLHNPAFSPMFYNETTLFMASISLKLLTKQNAYILSDQNPILVSYFSFELQKQMQIRLKYFVSILNITNYTSLYTTFYLENIIRLLLLFKKNPPHLTSLSSFLL